jgi:hypothetical protein
MFKGGVFLAWTIVLAGCLVVTAKQLFFAGVFDRDLVQKCVVLAAIAAATMWAIISEEWS